ncbi:HIT family protein [Enterococcus asini]|uniref:HIT family protein n=1 Tax=Enterococcus asini TaxID=57732 RepID=UPI00288D8EF0|nr:HIT family protein [Enterococcus asini]MDT2755933.1 HIT family protein [Enterococcus asini]
MTNCPFCQADLAIVFENRSCVAIFDCNPVSPGHLLLLPKAHRLDYFALTEAEKREMEDLILKSRVYLAQHFAPDGYNIGYNCGIAAGQSILHCHCHVIPRYFGDTQEPKGGVRGVIPAKQSY